MLFYRLLTLVSSNSHSKPSLMYAWCNNSLLPLKTCQFLFSTVSFLKTGCHIAQSGLHFNNKQQRTILKFWSSPWAYTYWVLGLYVTATSSLCGAENQTASVSYMQCRLSTDLVISQAFFVISNRTFHNPDIWLSCPNKHFQMVAVPTTLWDSMSVKVVC